MIKLLGIPYLVYNDYIKTSLYIPVGINCSGKCWKELSLDSSFCHNWDNKSIISLSVGEIKRLIEKYKLHSAYVLSGLEPFDNIDNAIDMIKIIRNIDNKDIVIYTGYNKNEVDLSKLKLFTNIVIKFGRYNPKLPKVYDKLLGITLSSCNQYAERIT